MTAKKADHGSRLFICKRSLCLRQLFIVLTNEPLHKQKRHPNRVMFLFDRDLGAEKIGAPAKYLSKSMTQQYGKG